MDSDYKQQPLKNCLVCRLEICLKAPGSNVDVIIAANLGTFTKVWLGCAGLVAGLAACRTQVSVFVRADNSITRGDDRRIHGGCL